MKRAIDIDGSGHSYNLDNFGPSSTPGGSGYQHLKFYKLDDGSGGVNASQEGTTNEAVLEALIDRLGKLNQKFPCRENAIVITKLEEALLWLDKRTADRKARGVEGTHTA